MSSTTSEIGYELGQTVRATNGPTTIVGEILHVYDSFGGWLEVAPAHLTHTTVPVYFDDGWVINIIEEQP